MDIWLYYDVIHRLHQYCNPVSEETVGELERILELGPETRVLDIASGMGEMLIGFNERWGATGVGVDVSPYMIDRANGRKARRTPDADLEFLNVGGEEYRTGERFDVTLCIGASWIWNGYAGTLDALKDFTKPGGLVVSAEPFWAKKPPAEYLAVEDFSEEAFTTLHRNLEIAREKGLSLVWMRECAAQDWDRYEFLQTASLDRFAREEPDHPDLEEIRSRLLPGKDAYLKWGRECFGFAFWVFRMPVG